jgi:hypothetical protein
MKKGWTMGIVFGAGAALLLASGFSAMANTDGYDAYMTALNHTKARTSLTADVDLSIADNGTRLLAGQAEIKLSRELRSGSMTAVLDDGTRTRTLNVYRQDGKVIFKTGEDDAYRVMERSGPPWARQNRQEALPNPPKAAERAFDALMGPMRDLATVEENADGTRQASLHLSGSQIPAVVQALGALIVSKAADGGGWNHGGRHPGGNWQPDGQEALPSSNKPAALPKLTDNVKVEQVRLDAVIDPDGALERQNADIRITGTDGSGRKHELAIRFQAVFSGFDRTVPDRIDLTGKKTEEIPSGGAHRGWPH